MPPSTISVEPGTPDLEMVVVLRVTLQVKDGEAQIIEVGGSQWDYAVGANELGHGWIAAVERQQAQEPEPETEGT